MFRAAFPDAPEEAEKTEALYVKNAFEAPGTSGAPSGRLRLAGTWITPQCAESIAADYNLKDMISALIKAKPDPGAIYRRSTKPSSGDSPSATAVGSPPPATTTAARRSDAAPSPAGAVNKRQRVSSPHQDPPATAAALLNSRQSNRLKSPVRATPPRTSPRVSGRTPARATPTRSTPARASRGSLGATVTPMVLDEDEEPEIGGQDADEGLAEGKAIFDEVAASYNVPPSAVKSARKRSAPEQSSDEPAPALPILPNLDGPGLQVARPIASNRRINFELNAEQKALAWGTLAFAFGMGVTCVFFSFFPIPVFAYVLPSDRSSCQCCHEHTNDYEIRRPLCFISRLPRNNLPQRKQRVYDRVAESGWRGLPLDRRV